MDGGSVVNDDGIMLIGNNTFDNNKASNGAGAVCSTYGTITITNSTFNQNTAKDEGAIYDNVGTFTVTNGISQTILQRMMVKHFTTYPQAT